MVRRNQTLIAREPDCSWVQLWRLGYGESTTNAGVQASSVGKHVSERLILLVEDNPADVVVVQMALSRIQPSLRVEIVGDGLAAIEYLSGKGPYREREKFPLPNLILLDLGLPRLDGFHVLEWVRTEPTLRSMPVVILAATCSSPDIQRAYAFGANSFITKPTELNKLVRDLQVALGHWLAVPAHSQAKPQLPGFQSAA
jgi:CheY-like chemotaxis protein